MISGPHGCSHCWRRRLGRHRGLNLCCCHGQACSCVLRPWLAGTCTASRRSSGATCPPLWVRFGQRAPGSSSTGSLSLLGDILRRVIHSLRARADNAALKDVADAVMRGVGNFVTHPRPRVVGLAAILVGGGEAMLDLGHRHRRRPCRIVCRRRHGQRIARNPDARL